ncbi:hypothetical protein [Streptomyces sp. NPDC047928]|uniref:effector-associated constant component EACC1 n=1 Tax=unclassified Streptomyces TaxID=2593676 RepID=UPI00371F135F
MRALTGGSPEQMGGGEFILAVVNTAIALGGFLVTSATWLDARRDRAAEGRRLHIERSGSRRAVTIDGAGPEQIERALRELLRPDEDAAGGEGGEFRFLDPAFHRGPSSETLAELLTQLRELVGSHGVA